jgi:hypothetical protein
VEPVGSSKVLSLANDKGEIVFRHVAPPGNGEVARIAANVCRRVGRLLERRGLGPGTDPEEADTHRQKQRLRDRKNELPFYIASIPGPLILPP